MALLPVSRWMITVHSFCLKWWYLSVFTAPYRRDQVKPDLAGPTHVSISTSRTASQQGCDNADGLNGTSASAAHVAGMAALLISNTNSSMSTFDTANAAAVDAIQSYLQTHTMDKTDVAGFAVGYDMSYGAGYTVLGSPTYNLSQVVTPLPVQTNYQQVVLAHRMLV